MIWEKETIQDATEGAELKVTLPVALYVDAPVPTNIIKNNTIPQIVFVETPITGEFERQ